MPFSLLFLAIVIGALLVAAFIVGNLPDDRAAFITPIMIIVTATVFVLGLIAQISKSP